MQDSYFGFLDFRAAQRRLRAKFSQPRGLLLHTLVFITVMMVIWLYSNVWWLWAYPQNYMLPTVIGAIWSMILAVHALAHYRRSAAVMERREEAVEDEMRQLVEKHREQIDPERWFEVDRELGADQERQARWSMGLTAFAMINAVSWAATTVNLGSSWAFQMTLPLAVLVIGGVQVFLNWQQQRRSELRTWFTRLPLRHIVAYASGVIALWMAGAYRLVNYWDAYNTRTVWGIVLLIHILWSVALWPAIEKWILHRTAAEQPRKRRSVEHLVLAEDGEVLDIVDEAWPPSDSQTSRQRI